MPLETGDFIPELDPNNPLGSDNVSLGDDHIRLLKRCTTGSFPAFVGTAGVPKSVALTEDQINDAALKSVFQTITNDWRFGAGLTLASGQYLASRNNINDAQINLLRTNANDDIDIGDNSSDSRMLSFLTHEQFINGGLVATWRTGGLNLENNKFYSCKDFGGSDRTVLGANASDNLFVGSTQFDRIDRFLATLSVERGGVELGIWNSLALNLRNGIALTSRNAADSAWLNMLRVSPANNLSVGEPTTLELFLETLSTTTMRVAGVDVAKFVARALGALLVRDRLGIEKKAGFRNPTRLAIGDNDLTVTQDHENQLIEVAPTILRTITIPALEDGTSFRIVNSGAAVDIEVVPTGGPQTFWYDASGTRKATTLARTLAGGSVMEVYVASSAAIFIWGNGIS